MTNYEKIIKLIISYDPSTWWAEYPPKFAYKNNIINEGLVKRSWQKIFKDKITPIADGKLIAESIPGAKFAVIKNVGHFVFLEKPEEFVKLIKDFAL